jgi:hypothetical protein
VYDKFVEAAGWGSSDNQDRDRVFAELDELITKYQQMIKQAEQQKKDFDNREQKAKDFVVGMLRLLGPTATDEAILNAMYVRFDTSPPKRKRAKKEPPPIEAAQLERVFDVLDGEGMTSMDIRRALPEGQQMDAGMLRLVLKELMDQKKIARDGEGRSSRYRRPDMGAPEPPEPEPEPAVEPGEEYEEGDEDDGDEFDSDGEPLE